MGRGHPGRPRARACVPQTRRGSAACDVRRELTSPHSTPRDLVALDDALNSLAAVYERKARVVELQHFGGLSVDETAGVLGVSPETVMRDWKFAKNWLLGELSRQSTRHE
jgi:DNA-directed RNA polymerase specialized sigma24 family protein